MQWYISMLVGCFNCFRPLFVEALISYYFCVDVSVSGSQLVASASPALAPLIVKTAKEVPHPSKAGKSLWDARNDIGPYEGDIDTEFSAMYKTSQSRKGSAFTGVVPMGSGSDFTVFLQRIGVSSDA